MKRERVCVCVREREEKQKRDMDIITVQSEIVLVAEPFILEERLLLRWWW
jgi:hypothetical protein